MNQQKKWLASERESKNEIYAQRSIVEYRWWTIDT